MNDLIDTAQMRAEEMLQAEIDAARKHAASSPVADGKCLFCDEDIQEEGRRFCDKYCAEDAEKYGTKDGGFIPVSDTTRINRGQRPNHLIR